jgi:hypothetical protein
MPPKKRQFGLKKPPKTNSFNELPKWLNALTKNVTADQIAPFRRRF